MPELGYKLQALAAIDPNHPVAPDSDTQTLSLFGREDIIAATSSDFVPTGCAAVPGAPAPLDEIARRARETSVVIINESHERSRGRGFTAQIAERLRPLGYDTLALETLSHPTPDVPERFRPAFLRHPELPYLEDGDGFYLSEAAYGRLGRRAKALGYRLLPYEDNLHNEPGPPVSAAEQMARRDESEAVNLAAFLKSHPTSKVLVHVGYSHAAEVPIDDGQKWLAARLKEKTGIDPLTISQTTCRGGSNVDHVSVLPASQPAGAFDLVVDHPAELFTHGRPAWRLQAGDRMVAIPRAWRPAKGWRVIEARPLGEPDASVPLDRVAIRPQDDVALMLPPGRYRIRAIDVPATGTNDPEK